MKAFTGIGWSSLAFLMQLGLYIQLVESLYPKEGEFEVKFVRPSDLNLAKIPERIRMFLAGPDTNNNVIITFTGREKNEHIKVRRIGREPPFFYPTSKNREVFKPLSA